MEALSVLEVGSGGRGGAPGTSGGLLPSPPGAARPAASAGVVQFTSSSMASSSGGVGGGTRMRQDSEDSLRTAGPTPPLLEQGLLGGAFGGGGGGGGGGGQHGGPVTVPPLLGSFGGPGGPQFMSDAAVVTDLGGDELLGASPVRPVPIAPHRPPDKSGSPRAQILSGAHGGGNSGAGGGSLVSSRIPMGGPGHLQAPSTGLSLTSATTTVTTLAPLDHTPTPRAMEEPIPAVVGPSNAVVLGPLAPPAQPGHPLPPQQHAGQDTSPRVRRVAAGTAGGSVAGGPTPTPPPHRPSPGLADSAQLIDVLAGDLLSQKPSPRQVHLATMSGKPSPTAVVPHRPDQMRSPRPGVRDISADRDPLAIPLGAPNRLPALAGAPLVDRSSSEEVPSPALNFTPPTRQLLEPVAGPPLTHRSPRAPSSKAVDPINMEQYHHHAPRQVTQLRPLGDELMVDA